MQQKIIRDQMSLGLKVEQIECKDHKMPITLVFLNSKNKLLNKAGCLECRASSDCTIFQINKIEEFLYNCYEDQQQQIQNIEQLFKNLITKSSQLVKRFNSYMSIQIQTLQQELDKFIESTQLTFIQKTVNNIANENRIGASTFQDIIQFLSDQEIIHNSIKLKTKNDIFTLLIDQSLFQPSKKIIKISKLIQYINERDQNWQQQLNEVIKKYESLQLDIDKQFSNFERSFYLIDDTLNGIYALANSYDDTYIASGDSLGNIILWDLQKQQKLLQYKCENRILELAFSKNSKLLAASLKNKIEQIDIQLFDLQNFICVQTINKPGSNIDSLLFTDDSKYLIAGGCLRVWDLENMTCIATQQIQNISSIKISSNQIYLLCGCFENGQAHLLNCEQLNNLQSIVDWRSSEEKTTIRTIVAFSPDDENVIIGSTGIKIWKVKELIQNIIQPSIIVQPYSHFIRSMDLLINGKIIMRQDQTCIQFYNSSNGSELYRIQEDKSLIFRAHVTRNMEVIIASFSNLLVIYKKASSK